MRLEFVATREPLLQTAMAPYQLNQALTPIANTMWVLQARLTGCELSASTTTTATTTSGGGITVGPAPVPADTSPALGGGGGAAGTNPTAPTPVTGGGTSGGGAKTPLVAAAAAGGVGAAVVAVVAVVAAVARRRRRRAEEAAASDRAKPYNSRRKLGAGEDDTVGKSRGLALRPWTQWSATTRPMRAQRVLRACVRLTSPVGRLSQRYGCMGLCSTPPCLCRSLPCSPLPPSAPLPHTRL